MAAAIAGTFFCLYPTQAIAKNPTPQQIKTAAEEFDRGIRAAQAGNFDEAGSHFEAADREAPSPDALRAAIRARRDAQQGARASTLAGQALTRYPKDTDLIEFAKATLSQFTGKLHKVAITCKPECLLVVDNKLIPAEAAAETTLYLDPGNHSISAGWNEKNQTKELTALAGGSSSLSFSPPKEDSPKPLPISPSASAPTPNPPASTSKQEISPEQLPKGGLSPAFTYAGIGLTVVLGGITVWSGLDTQSNPGPNKVKEKCVGLGENCKEYKDGLAKQQRTNVLLAATGGTAVLTGLIAAIWTNWGGSDTTSASRKQPSWMPGISLDGSGATLHAAGKF